MQKKHKYSKNEFINIVCKNCGLCKNIGNPVFCYTTIYKNHKRKFIRKVFPKLLALRKRQNSSGKLLYAANLDNIESVFKQTFVKDNFIKHKNAFKYLITFRAQLNDDADITIKIPKSKKKRQKYIAKAYPTFFSNDRGGLQEEINRALSSKN